MEPFDKNVAFVSVDLVVMCELRPTMVRKLLGDVLAQFEQDNYVPVRPVMEMPMSEIENAFRLIQGRRHTGKIVMTAEDNILVKTTQPKPAKLNLGTNGTYVIAGGLGSVGMAMAKLMAQSGAKHIVLLGRRPVDFELQRALQLEYNEFGAEIKIMSCDITEMAKVQGMASEINKTMPAIRGIVQATVVIHVSFQSSCDQIILTNFQDRILEMMKSEDYNIALRPKVAGTKNLIMGVESDDLDFFLLLSSCVSIVGSRSQSNYAAANSYMDALAMSSLNPRTHYASLNATLVEDSDLAAQPERIRNLARQGCIPMSVDELLRLSEYLMSPQAMLDQYKQVVVGFNRQSVSSQEGLYTLKSALFNHLPYTENKAGGNSSGKAASQSIEELLSIAKYTQEINSIVAKYVLLCELSCKRRAYDNYRALAEKLSALVAIDEISLESPIDEFGLDSLIAIELKNWIGRVFQAAMQTNEILDAPNIRTLASKVAVKSTIIKTDGNVSTDNDKPVDVEPPNRDFVQNGRAIRASGKLPNQPLPELEATFNHFIESVRVFGTEKGLGQTRKAIEELQGPGSVGQKLQARLAK